MKLFWTDRPWRLFRVPENLSQVSATKGPKLRKHNCKELQSRTYQSEEVTIVSYYWTLIATDFGFTGGITAAIIIFAVALARKEAREATSTSDRNNAESLRQAS